MQVASPDETHLTKIGLYFFPMHIKLPLTAMFEFNMEHNETMLCMCGYRRGGGWKGGGGGGGREEGDEGGKDGRSDFMVRESPDATDLASC